MRPVAGEETQRNPTFVKATIFQRRVNELWLIVWIKLVVLAKKKKTVVLTTDIEKKATHN